MIPIPLMLLFYSGAMVLNKVSSKTCSNVVAAKSNRIKYLLYLLLVSIFASIVFFILNGFKILCTPSTLLFALAFCTVCTLSAICHLEIFKFSNIAGVVVLSSFGSLVATAIVGFFVFNEEVAPRTLLKIFLMFIPAVLTFIESSKNNKSSEKKDILVLIKLTIIIVLIIICGCGTTIILKFYANNPNVTDNNSMFFFTNVFQGVGTVLVLLFHIIKGRSNTQLLVNINEALRILRPLPIIAIVCNTAASNIGTLLSAELIKRMDISIYTPISSALGIIAGVIASFIYRESHGIYFYLSAIFAIIAVVV